MKSFRKLAVTSLVLAPLAAGGCSTIDEYTPDLGLFDDDETVAEEQAGNPEGDRDYPNVADTPEGLQASAEEERSELAEGLRADNSRTRYAADAIRRQGDLPEDMPSAMAPPPTAAPSVAVVEAPAPMAPKPAAAPSTPQPVQTASAAAPAPATPPMPWLGPRPQPLQVVTSASQAGAVMPTRPGGTYGGIYDPTMGGPVVVSSNGVMPATPGYSGTMSAQRVGTLTATDRMASGLPGNAQKIATIQFQDGSSSLSGHDRRILGQVVALHRQKGGTVKVVGHASSRTKDMDPVKHKMVNLDISVARADAVVRELVRQGAAAERVQTAAVSDREPVYYEVMPSGEAGNRRTEIYFVY